VGEPSLRAGTHQPPQGQGLWARDGHARPAYDGLDDLGELCEICGYRTRPTGPLEWELVECQWCRARVGVQVQRDERVQQAACGRIGGGAAQGEKAMGGDNCFRAVSMGSSMTEAVRLLIQAKHASGEGLWATRTVAPGIFELDNFPISHLDYTMGDLVTAADDGDGQVYINGWPNAASAGSELTTRGTGTRSPTSRMIAASRAQAAASAVYKRNTTGWTSPARGTR
jgi:hypothetical protein